jgi:hypothetical protein
LPQTTLVSAIFNSASRVKLADAAGLRMADVEPRAQYIAGKTADVDTLAMALALGMRCTDQLLRGAAISGSLCKLQWCHAEHRCQFPDDISKWAAMCGSIDALRFLKQCGCKFDADTCYWAAGSGQLQTVQYLHFEEGFKLTYCVANQAGHSGNLSILQWLFEQGCDQYMGIVTYWTAYGGYLRVLEWLQQQGAQFDARTMRGAAWNGQLQVCANLTCTTQAVNNFESLLLVRTANAYCDWLTASVLRTLHCKTW